MEKQWFVLHTLTGQEYKVRDSIMIRRESAEMDEYIEEVLIPTEQVSEVKKGVRSTSTRKFFPGYVLVKVALFDEERNIRERAWYFIKDTPGTIGFIGGECPVPLRDSEVQDILDQAEDKTDSAKPKISFEPGETVKIIDGPFVSFNGLVEEVDPDRGKIKVSVSIFGRAAPVELEYWQVEREE